MKTPEKELKEPDYGDLSSEFYDEESCAPWYVAVRAVESLRDKNYGRNPGYTEKALEGDFAALRAEADAIMSKVNPENNDGIALKDQYLREMLRFSDSKIHTVSAFLGGVASQEAIKLLIRQYTPLNHTLIYDGIHGRNQVFNV